MSAHWLGKEVLYAREDAFFSERKRIQEVGRNGLERSFPQEATSAPGFYLRAVDIFGPFG